MAWLASGTWFCNPWLVLRHVLAWLAKGIWFCNLWLKLRHVLAWLARGTWFCNLWLGLRHVLVWLGNLWLRLGHVLVWLARGTWFCNLWLRHVLAWLAMGTWLCIAIAIPKLGLRHVLVCNWLCFTSTFPFSLAPPFAPTKSSPFSLTPAPAPTLRVQKNVFWAWLFGWLLFFIFDVWVTSIFCILLYQVQEVTIF